MSTHHLVDDDGHVVPIDAYRRRALDEEPDPWREGLLTAFVMILGIVGGPILWIVAVELGIRWGGQ